MRPVPPALRRKILLADDEPNLRILVNVTLSGPGYEILQAADGMSALAVVRNERPHLILLDWMMPGLSGIEVAQRLREDARPHRCR